jgi:hypothetical protein
MEPEWQGTTSATVQVPCSLWVTVTCGQLTAGFSSQSRPPRTHWQGLRVASSRLPAARELEIQTGEGAHARSEMAQVQLMSQHSGCHQRTRTLSGSAPACFALLKWLAPGATQPFPWPAQTASLANPRSHPCLTLIDMAQLRLCGFVRNWILRFFVNWWS